ncbi:DUF1090 domain-containing protein [Photobacterium phosphoreum]|uniref:DUF1090 domain-containing protein n=1 Tax=Photobacterium phosphoreum TaxID=659 RepID=UPI0024BB9504|nr:DUF1090 domain-containing protein [Photobacterium phosphoreum]
MIKNIATPTILMTIFLLSTTVQATEITGCAVKKQEIKTQISYAKEYNNTYQLKGLQKALAEVNDNCTDESLKAEQLKKVANKEKKVEERKQELIEAKESGKKNKINKKERKLQEAIDELQDEKNTYLHYFK